MVYHVCVVKALFLIRYRDCVRRWPNSHPDPRQLTGRNTSHPFRSSKLSSSRSSISTLTFAVPVRRGGSGGPASSDSIPQLARRCGGILRNVGVGDSGLETGGEIPAATAAVALRGGGRVGRSRWDGSLDGGLGVEVGDIVVLSREGFFGTGGAALREAEERVGADKVDRDEVDAPVLVRVRGLGISSSRRDVDWLE